MKQFSLRVLSVILSITLLAANFVTTITALDGIGLLGGEDSAKRETVTVTDAKIVAEYYGFVSEGEKIVLNCDAIIGETHDIPVPQDDDDLVLVDGLTNLEDLAACEGDLLTIASEPVFSAFLKMTEPVKFGNAQIDFFPEGEAGYDAIKAMEAERNANGGVFNLCKEIDAYRKESNALKYLLANGENVKTVADDMLGYISALTDDKEGLGAKLWIFDVALELGHLTEQDVNNINLLNDILESLKTDLENVKEI